jgi:subtilisin family serine protease
MKGFAAAIPPGRLRAIAADPRVDYIEPDGVIQAIAQEIPTGVDRIEADESSTIAGNGSGSVGVKVAVLDTGIQSSHPDLNVVGGRNFSGGPAYNYNDVNGHGTHVAGIIGARDNNTGVVGVAPGAPLYAVKVLSNSGYGTWSGFCKGVDWVCQQGIKVANASLSGGYSQAANDCVAKAVNRYGVCFAVAAGNEGADACSSSPASCPEALTVGALADLDGQPGGDSLASFSNYGSCVDILAPGVSIKSTWKSGGYASLSGTSMASPHVAGAAALYLATHPGSTPTVLRGALLGAVTEYFAGPDLASYGLLNAGSF